MTIYNEITVPLILKDLVQGIFKLEDGYFKTTDLGNEWDPVFYKLDEDLQLTTDRTYSDTSPFDSRVLAGDFTGLVYFWNGNGANRVLYFENNRLTLMANVNWCHYPCEDRSDFPPDMFDHIVECVRNANGLSKLVHYKIAHDNTDDPHVVSLYLKMFPKEEVK